MFAEKVQIKQAISESEKDDIFKFRYRIYIEEMSRKQKYADHAAKTIKEPLDDDAYLLAAYDSDGLLIGTCRTNHFSNLTLGGGIFTQRKPQIQY